MGLKKRQRRTPHGDVIEENSEDDPQIQDLKDFGTRLNDVITDGYLIMFLLITCFTFSCYVANWFYDIYLISYFVIQEDYWYSFFVSVFWLTAALHTGITSYKFYNNNGENIIPRNLLLSESFHSIALTWVFHFIFLGLFTR